jgi:hypothetical protein
MESMFDTSKENSEKLIADGKQIIENTKQNYKNKAKIVEDEYNTAIKNAAVVNNMDAKKIEDLTFEYSINKKLLELGTEFTKLKAVPETITSTGTGMSGSTISINPAYAAAQNKLKKLPEEVKDAFEESQKMIAAMNPKLQQEAYDALIIPNIVAAAQMAEKFSKVTFPEMGMVADLKAQQTELEGQAQTGPKRIERQVKAAEKRQKDDAIAAAKKAKEDAELDNRIKATQELLKNANDGERDAIAKRLVLLEQEKKLIEWKNEAAKAMAANKPLKPIGADTALGAIREAAKASGIDLDKLKLKDTDLEVDKIKRGNSAREAEANRLRKKYNIEDKKDTKELAENYYAVADAADMLSNAIGDSNAGLADMLKGVGSVAGQMGNLVKAGAFDKMGEDGMSQGDAISSAVSGTTQLIGIVVGAAAERKRVMEEYYASIIAQQQQYNLLLNDQLRLNSDINGSVFFTNYEGKLNDSTKAFNDATSKYNEETKKFATSEAITGKKNVVSGANVIGGIGAGAAAGAGIGALLGGGVLSVPAAAVGAVIGSVVGLFTGLFAKKKKDVVAPLLETYKDLISPAGEFNEVLAKTLIANNKVTEATKATLQNLIDWKEQAKLAREQLTAVIKDLTGGLGDDLRNALVGAFTDGTDAATAFGDSVNNVLENVMSNMIFNKVFEGAFKQLEDGMNASYGIGPDGKPMTGSKVDGKWADDLKTFFDQSKGLTDQFNQGLADAKAEAAANGMAIFGKDTSAGGATGMKGDIARMTEETGSALSGNITAIRINMARMIESGNDSMTMLQRSLELQARTADNTDVMSKTLNNIDTRLSRIELDGLKVK